MPFYLALPRPATFSGKTQGGSMTRNEYIRSAPSSILYQLATGYLPPMKTVVYTVLGQFARILSLNPSGDTMTLLPGNRFFTRPYKVADCPKLILPNVDIQLSGRPIEADMDIIKNAGGEARRIAGMAMDTWVVSPITLDQLVSLVSLTNVKMTTKPVEGSITAQAIPTLIQFISTTMFIAELLYIVSPQSPLGISLDVSGNTSATNTTTIEEGEVSETNTMEVESGTPSGAQTVTISTSDIIALRGITLTNVATSTSRLVFGQVSDCPTGNGGIFIPFEQAYAAYDILIATQFIEAFKSVFFSDFVEYEEESHHVLQQWANGIYRTKTGDFLAHMMKVLLLAKEAGTWAFFIINQDGLYQGAVLQGEDIMVKQVGKRWVESSSTADLIKELEVCGSHSRSVQRVLDYAGMSTSSPDQFKTLRQLSAAVNAGGEPGGANKNLIMKEMPNISFVERPEPVNATSMRRCIQLLVTSDHIPDDLFMDRGFFFPKDRYEAVLTMFGTSAPCFNTGGIQEIRSCSIAPKRILALPYDRNTPPKVLQAIKMQIGPASTHWRDMLENGHINGTFDRETAGSRKFMGTEKEVLWHAFDDLGRLVVKGGDVKETPIASGSGGGAKRGPTEEDARADRLKKMKRFM